MIEALKTSLSASVRVLIYSLIALAGATPAGAHDPGLSTAAVTIKDKDIAIVLTFARKDVENLVVQSPSGEMAECAIVDLKMDDRTIQPRSTRIRHNDDVYEFYFHFPRDGECSLSYCFPFFENLPLGHRQFVTVSDAPGQSLSERMLSERDNRFDVSLPQLKLGKVPIGGETISARSLISPWFAFELLLGVSAAMWLIMRTRRFTYRTGVLENAGRSIL